MAQHSIYNMHIADLLRSLIVLLILPNVHQENVNAINNYTNCIAHNTLLFIIFWIVAFGLLTKYRWDYLKIIPLKSRLSFDRFVKQGGHILLPESLGGGDDHHTILDR